MTSPTLRRRSGTLDSLRGLTLVSMIAYHACWDLVYLYGMPWDWYRSFWAYAWQQSICCTFILLSGYCWQMGRHPLRRGLDAEKLMEKYVREVQGPASHDRYAGLEWIPRFFSVFRWAFRKTTSSSDAWVSTFEEQPEEFDLTIHQCLWHDTCVSCGCPEACRFFCECDNYAFGDLKRVGFHRTQTLGTGGDCCDFHFYKK